MQLSLLLAETNFNLELLLLSSWGMLLGRKAVNSWTSITSPFSIPEMFPLLNISFPQPLPPMFSSLIPLLLSLRIFLLSLFFLLLLPPILSLPLLLLPNYLQPHLNFFLFLYLGGLLDPLNVLSTTKIMFVTLHHVPIILLLSLPPMSLYTINMLYLVHLGKRPCLKSFKLWRPIPYGI